MKGKSKGFPKSSKTNWRKETFDFVFAKPVDIDISGRPKKRLSVLIVDTVRFLIALSSPL